VQNRPSSVQVTAVAVLAAIDRITGLAPITEFSVITYRIVGCMVTAVWASLQESIVQSTRRCNRVVCRTDSFRQRRFQHHCSIARHHNPHSPDSLPHRRCLYPHCQTVPVVQGLPLLTQESASSLHDSGAGAELPVIARKPVCPAGSHSPYRRSPNRLQNCPSSQTALLGCMVTAVLCLIAGIDGAIHIIVTIWRRAGLAVPGSTGFSAVAVLPVITICIYLTAYHIAGIGILIADCAFGTGVSAAHTGIGSFVGMIRCRYRINYRPGS